MKYDITKTLGYEVMLAAGQVAACIAILAIVFIVMLASCYGLWNLCNAIFK